MTHAEGPSYTEGQNTTGKAYTYEASGSKTVAPMPFMQDTCFLCSGKIGESDPRQFYTGPAGSTGVLMLAHTGCLLKFKANGEVWPEEEPKPKIDDLGDVRRVVHGNARLVFTPRHLSLSCDDLILQYGLKAVLPDLIVALRAVQESL